MDDDELKIPDEFKVEKYPTIEEEAELIPRKEKKTQSIPRFDDFDRLNIEWQWKFLDDYEYNIPWRKGVQTIVLSGAVGSGKTTVVCNMILLHCMRYPGAYVALVRRTEGALKSTLHAALLKHLPSYWTEGDDYTHNRTTGEITLLGYGNSKICCFSFAAGQKVEQDLRSEEFSAAVIEEASESEEWYYKAISSRVRLSHVPEKFILMSTNPADEEHYIASSIIARAGYVNGVKVADIRDTTVMNYRVYYSLTRDNWFLDDTYIQDCLNRWNERECQRYLEGKWISLAKDGVYFAYDDREHYLNKDYEINPLLPIRICFDFSAASRKLIPAVFGQYDPAKDTFHWFDEIVIEGGNTSSLIEEVIAKMEPKYRYILHGDASGWHKSSSSLGFCDYDIIKKALENCGTKLSYTFQIPTVNGSIKARHNIINSYFKNGYGQAKMFVYKGTAKKAKCPTLNKAFKSTKLKPGASYTEDQSIGQEFMDAGVAAGYGVVMAIASKSASKIY